MVIHTIAAVLQEFGYLGVGLLLCFMGQRLLERGIEGKTKVEGGIGGKKWMLLTSSPGIVFAVCGLAIILYAIITPSVYEEEVKRRVTEGANQPTTEVTTTMSSRLLNQRSEGTILRARVAIYALQKSVNALGDENVKYLMNQMPVQPGVEQWSQTYQRFAEILKKNPRELKEMLAQPKFKWLAMRDQEDRSLSNLIDAELKLLMLTVKAGEKD